MVVCKDQRSRNILSFELLLQLRALDLPLKNEKATYTETEKESRRSGNYTQRAACKCRMTGAQRSATNSLIISKANTSCGHATVSKVAFVEVAMSLLRGQLSEAVCVRSAPRSLTALFTNRLLEISLWGKTTTAALAEPPSSLSKCCSAGNSYLYRRAP
jgi:hypothetical protein